MKAVVLEEQGVINVRDGLVQIEFITDSMDG